MFSGVPVSSGSFDIDFQYWANLAQQDPAAYFAQRAALIEAFIASVPLQHQDDLRRLQALIDGTRLEAGSPVTATRKLMLMLSEHLAAMQSQLVLLRDESQQLSDCFARLAE